MLAVGFRVIALTAGIVLCTVLPFLPGRHDGVAVTLSMTARLFGLVGLLLVPVGAVWVATQYMRRLARFRNLCAVIGLFAVSAVWIVVSLAAALESLSLGLGSLALGTHGIARAARSQTLRSRTQPHTASTVPLYFILVPVIVAVIQEGLAGPITEFSRNRAIRNSLPLIADIERYRAVNGHYPRSLLSVNRDYLPSVIGIKEYRYEPRGDAYNVVFEQITLELGVKEIVVYNPLDQHAMASHAMDVLQLTPAELAIDQMRGHNAVHDASHPHWKYFWFD